MRVGKEPLCMGVSERPGLFIDKAEQLMVEGRGDSLCS